MTANKYEHLTSLCYIAVQCPRDILNGQLSDSCSLDVGEVCTSFNCNYGYETIGSISINCTAAGTWNADTSILCTGLYI